MRAVEKRADGLPANYRRKARDADTESRAASGDPKGPVEQKLESHGDLIGLVFGAWSEGSEGVHNLIQTLAQSRLYSQQRTRGRPGDQQELGNITSQIRRRLSQVVVKAQAECLLSRLHQVGPGSRSMAQRRQWALQEDQKMRRERQAQWLRKTEGVYTIRKGHIKTA